MHKVWDKWMLFCLFWLILIRPLLDWGSVRTTSQPIGIPTHFVRMCTIRFWTRIERKKKQKFSTECLCFVPFNCFFVFVIFLLFSHTKKKEKMPHTNRENFPKQIHFIDLQLRKQNYCGTNNPLQIQRLNLPMKQFNLYYNLQFTQTKISNIVHRSLLVKLQMNFFCGVDLPFLLLCKCFFFVFVRRFISYGISVLLKWPISMDCIKSVSIDFMALCVRLEREREGEGETEWEKEIILLTHASWILIAFTNLLAFAYLMRTKMCFYMIPNIQRTIIPVAFFFQVQAICQRCLVQSKWFKHETWHWKKWRVFF